jgi:hypothetical protein|tara:strand:+ start:267 stop:644 length:378 start_codon:yes stop_codon:yes gene_type:complete
MALSVSGFSDAFDYTIVNESAATATANKNVTLSSGTLMSVFIDNTAGTQTCYAKLYDGENCTVGSTAPQLVLKCAASSTQRYDFEEGYPFSNLNMWVTKLPAHTDTTVPTVSSGTVGLTVVVKAE